MNEHIIVLLLAGLASFLVTFFLTPIYIRFIKAVGIVGVDVHKKNKAKIAELGGLCVVSGFLAGLFLYITIQTFVYNTITKPNLIDILAVISTILIVTFIGFLDCLTSLMKLREGKSKLEKFKRVGLRKVISFLLPFPAAVPLIAVKAGVDVMSVPLFGDVSFGLIYPLLLVPIAIVGASNATNMLAGFNGMESGMGFVVFITLGIFSLAKGRFLAAMLSFTFAFALLAFLKYNRYPAKIFPGDLNYVIGAMIACVAIVGNIEKFAIICFLPWFVEFFLKLRSKFKAENFGILQADGTLKTPYKKSYSLTHVVMKLGKFKEWQISGIMILLEIVVCALALTFSLGLL